MNKKNIIIISCIVAALIIIAIVLILLISNKKRAKIEVYDYKFNLEKTVEVKDKKIIKQLEEMFEQGAKNKIDDIQNEAIRNEIKIFLNDGKYFVLSLNYKNYCYIADPKENMEMIIPMPKDLPELVSDLIGY